MKPFNLKEALSGKPVKLRNGQKALICYRIPDEYVFNNGSSAASPLQGIIFNKRGNLQQIAEVWRDNGTYGDGYLHKFDIIGMWEDIIDPKDLPKAFIPKKDEIYYYIHPHETNFYLDVHETTCSNCRFDEILSDTGNCFRTRKDAQKWLDFMESMKE